MSSILVILVYAGKLTEIMAQFIAIFGGFFMIFAVISMFLTILYSLMRLVKLVRSKA
jgi:hypothetical protein